MAIRCAVPAGMRRSASAPAASTAASPGATRGGSLATVHASLDHVLPEDGQPIAVVGLACQYPDADDPATLLDAVITGRRAFRRLPPGRLDLTGCVRAALIDGWRFDPAVFGLTDPARTDAGPSQWLAVETAGRALAAAGFAGRTGRTSRTSRTGRAGRAGRARGAVLPSDRTGVFIGTALTTGGHSGDRSPSGAPGGDTSPDIAVSICRQFGLRGGGFAIDAGGASSLAAVASACHVLSCGELDLAVAGGVEVILDPLSLTRMARGGQLATRQMRIYDEDPTGFLPGEGCGMVLLMRTADARAAGLPVYAEILGWGTATSGRQREVPADASAQLAAMRQAYEMAGTDPADVQLIEGCGSAVAAVDEAELTAITALRDGARRSAALGSITANFGNTGAASGAAGLIKSVLALANGVVPPATGTRRPHPMLRDDRAALRLPESPELWPDGTRRASVGAHGTDGLAIHLVLRSEPGQSSSSRRLPRAALRALVGRNRPAQAGAPSQDRPSRQARSLRTAPARSKARTGPEFAGRPAASRPPGRYPADCRHPFAYLFQAPDLAALTKLLQRTAHVAPLLSDAQLQDLAVHLARTAAVDRAGPDQARAGIVAVSQEQLAARAAAAIDLLTRPVTSALITQPGIYAAGLGAARGSIAVLLSGQGDGPLDLPQHQLNRTLSALQWLEDLGVHPTTAVGHGVGELAGLVWAGCLGPVQARTLNAARAAAVAAAPGAAPGLLSAAMTAFAGTGYRPPRRRLISGCTGDPVTEPDTIADQLSAELFDARLAAGGRPSDAGRRLADAVAVASEPACLLLRIGTDRELASAGLDGLIPLVSIDGDPAGDRHVMHAAAALFAAGALGRPDALYAGRPGRPIDIWREPVFIADSFRARAQPAAPAQSGQGDAGAPGIRPGVLGTADPSPAGPSPAGLRQISTRQISTRQMTTRQISTRQISTGQPAVGVGPWSRCYAEEVREPARRVRRGDDRPWRLHTGGCEPLRNKAAEVFRHDPDAGRTVAVLGSLGDDGTLDAALLAARDAISTGQLVAVSPGPGLAGFWAGLHAEHPSVGITAIRAPMTGPGLRAASRFAAVTPGEYRELIVSPGPAAGEPGSVVVREPVMVAAELTSGADFPLGPDDVILISRAAGAAGLALAQVLACSGATAVIVGRDHPAHDDQVVASLEELRRAGARISYEIVDLADPVALTAAVRRVSRRVGPVTAIVHATSPAPRAVLTSLAPAEICEHVRGQTAALGQLAAAVRAAGAAGPAGAAGTATAQAPGTLRLVLTFGSVAGRYGRAGDAILALATGALSDKCERLAAATPGCRGLHVDWPAWTVADAGAGADLTGARERGGDALMSVTRGSRQLVKLLSADGLPGRLAVHGRVGLLPPQPVALAGRDWATQRTHGRFVERVLVHYPGVELVAEARLSLRSDPYLGEYLVDGVPMLPAAMALEAMAQAAAALAGVPVRDAAGVVITAPVVIPPGLAGAAATVRICALREGDAVHVVLRCDSSGFATEHCRATFGCTPAAGPPARSRPVTSAGTAVDGSELYRSVCFQTGRFARLVTVHPESSHSATALAHGADELPWFGPDGSGELAAGRELLLGSAGIGDATLQLVQACVPHRRLMLAGCESVTFSGLEPEGAVLIRAVQVGHAPADSMITAGLPRYATGTRHDHGVGGSVWDAEARDAAGRPLVTWRRLRMRDVGPLPPAGPWPAPLLACYLERAAAELGLGSDLRVRIDRQEKNGRELTSQAVPAAGIPRQAGPAEAAHTGGMVRRGGWVRAVSADDDLTGLVLRVRAAERPAACAWHTMAAFADSQIPAAALAGATPEQVRAIAGCLPATRVPPDAAVSQHHVAGIRWLVLRAGDATIASAVLDVAGVERPVAVALLTSGPARSATPVWPAQVEVQVAN